jgi:hypothetical protein
MLHFDTLGGNNEKISSAFNILSSIPNLGGKYPGREIPNNGEFFQDENLWKSYYATI